MKKNIFILLLWLLLFVPLNAEDNQKKTEINENQYLSRLSILLNQYEVFMTDNGNKESDYYKAFILFKEKLDASETTFSLDISNSNLIDGGARFRISEELNEYYISIGYKLVDIFDFYPTLIFSILTHEIWHAYAYVTNPEGFLMHDSDPFEKQLYEFDAIINEAIFIDETLINSNFILTDFENYLRSCYVEKKITDFISPTLKVDYYTINDLYDIRNEYYIDMDKVKLDTSLGKIGANLLKYYNESLTTEDPWFTYKILIGLKTYYDYSIVLFKQTEGNENSEQTWDDIFKNYPEFNNFYSQISTIIDKSDNYIDERHSEYINHFNKNLLY